MKIKFLLEEGTFQDNLEPIKMAIKKLGYEFKTIKYRPFISDQDWPYDPKSEDCIITIGSINLIRQVQRSCKWVPGTFANWENFRFSTWINYYNKWSLNNDFTIYPYKYLIKVFNHIYNQWNYGNGIFIKSDEGCKIFGGGIFNNRNELTTRMTQCKDNTLCVVASAYKVYSEYRFFVYLDEIISGSRYYNQDGQIECQSPYEMDANDLEEYNRAVDFAKECLTNETWRPDEIFVMDIGFIGDFITQETRPCLIEINSASCSGWYACDPKRTIDALAKAAASEWRNIYECN